MPTLEEAADARRAMAAILTAVAEGDLTPGEGATLGKLVADFIDIDGDTEVQRRIRERRKNDAFSASGR